MKNQLVKLGGESLVYGLSGIISKFVSFFLIPFYARKFTTAEYGEIALLNSIFFFLSTIITLGLDSAVYRWYYDYEDNSKRINLIRIWFKYELIFTSVIAFLLFAISPFFSGKFFSSPHSVYFLWIIGANLLFNIVPPMIIAWLRLNRKPWPTVFFSTGMVLVSVIFAFVFVILLNWGVLGFFIGQAAGFLVFTIFGLIKYNHLFRWARIDLNLLKSMMRYGLGILPASLTSSTVVLMTNFIIQSNISQSDLGLYQMGNNIAMLILLITSAFGQAWAPFSFSILGEKDFLRIYANVLDVYVYFLSAVSLFIGLFAHETLLILTTDKFIGSAWVAGILAYSYFISSLSVIAITGMSVIKDVKWYSPIVIISSLFTLFLQLVFVRYGKEAIALAILLGQSFASLALFYIAQKKYPIPYRFQKNAIVVLFSIFCFVLGKKIVWYGFWQLIMLKLVICLIFILLIAFLERKQLISLVQVRKVKEAL